MAQKRIAASDVRGIFRLNMNLDMLGPASLFVGRWQPFHAGHKKLIETVLKKGKPVIIAVRDTELSHQNPYTVTERRVMIRRALRKYGELVYVMAIPDIDEICYGRDVGYAIRRIELDRRTEQVSGTKTRAKKKPVHPIVWLTGQTRSGKTSIANELAPVIGGVVLDGDEMRESISKGAGFSKADRDEHNIRVARLALVLARRTPVIVSVIAPFESTRKKINALIRPVWVYVKRNVPITKQKPYEAPKAPDFTLTVTKRTTSAALAEELLQFLRAKNIL